VNGSVKGIGGRERKGSMAGGREADEGGKSRRGDRDFFLSLENFVIKHQIYLYSK